MTTAIKLRHSGGLFDLQVPLCILHHCAQLETEEVLVLEGSCKRLGGKNAERVELYAERRDTNLSLTFQTAAMGSLLQRKLTQVWHCEVDSCRPEELEDTEQSANQQTDVPVGGEQPANQGTDILEPGEHPANQQIDFHLVEEQPANQGTDILEPSEHPANQQIDFHEVEEKPTNQGTDVVMGGEYQADQETGNTVDGDELANQKTDFAVGGEEPANQECAIDGSNHEQPMETWNEEEQAILPSSVTDATSWEIVSDTELVGVIQQLKSQMSSLGPDVVVQSTEHADPEGLALQTTQVSGSECLDTSSVEDSYITVEVLDLQSQSPSSISATAVNEENSGEQEMEDKNLEGVDEMVTKLSGLDSDNIDDKPSTTDTKCVNNISVDKLELRRSARRAALVCEHCGKANFRGKAALKLHTSTCTKATKRKNRKTKQKENKSVKERKQRSRKESKSESPLKSETVPSTQQKVPAVRIKQEKPEAVEDPPPVSDLRCPHCDRTWFSSRKHFPLHVRECHKNPENKDRASTKPHVCEQCQYATDSQYALKRHRRDVHGIKGKRKRKDPEYRSKLEGALGDTSDVSDLQCPYCDRTWFVSRAAFAIHFKDCYKSNEGESPAVKPFQCEDCKARFNKQETLRRHRREVHNVTFPRRFKSDGGKKKRPPPDAPSICQFCGRTFQYPVSLKAHIKYRCKLNPDVTKGHYCTICNQIFTDRGDLAKHVEEQHPDGVQYICHLCGLVFRSRSGIYFHRLRKHSAAETALKYECPVCHKRFDSNVRMQSHKTKHFDERNFSCEMCGKRFKNMAQVKNHIKAIHDNKYTYYCDKCGHGMQKKKYLDAHVCGRVRRSQGGATEQIVPPLAQAPPTNDQLANQQEEDTTMTQHIHVLTNPAPNSTANISGQVSLIMSTQDPATEQFNVQVGRLNEQGHYELENVATFTEVDAATQYIQQLNYSM